MPILSTGIIGRLPASLDASRVQALPFVGSFATKGFASCLDLSTPTGQPRRQRTTFFSHIFVIGPRRQPGSRVPLASLPASRSDDEVGYA